MKGEIEHRILETAERAFAEHGFRAVGVDALAHACGISKVTLYRYVRSKDALIAAVLRSRCEAIRTALHAAQEAAPPGMARLRSLFRALDLNGRGDRLLLNALFELADDSEVQEIGTDHYEAVRLIVHQVLGELAPPAILDQLSRQIVNLLRGATVSSLLDRPGVATQDAWECAVQLVQYARLPVSHHLRSHAGRSDDAYTADLT
ncbi:helix-turn-helix domain-containing protein [Caballeronia sp. LZ016]|uniref:TetR/AcrR family transcriptional regulator n=1 Tax=Caballeronia sp. LZ016 TaxID=3038554 RepID=UPI00286699A4|nr:helix-turn-helix domain-containing protein [Caballeronia sp. LZ016]MDR5738064.1 helix-turn-helix domain containing protein [Caballeronia sp. LZ016]